MAVRSSPIEGLGLFAQRGFVEGETVLRWHPKRLSAAEFESTAPEDRRYLSPARYPATGGLLMQVPERYVNSTGSPNTRTHGESDVALRDIAAGEELTSNYPLLEFGSNSEPTAKL